MTEAENILSLSGFGVAFNEKIVLSTVTLDIPDRGVFVLMGPAGTGKSTLLRTLAGYNDSNPGFRSWGKAHFAGGPLGDHERPSLVMQNARLLMSSVMENIIHDLPERSQLTILQQKDVAIRLLEQAGLPELSKNLNVNVVDLPTAKQRHLSIVRQVAASPKMLCIDEPTSDLSDEDCERILAYIKEEGEKRAVLVVVHNQMQARQLGGVVALLAGGWVQEVQPSKKFFTSPESDAAREYIRNGICSVPSPNTRPEDIDEQYRVKKPKLPKAAAKYVSDSFGPRGFLWLKKGKLAGTPRPGIVSELDYDLKGLKRVGITYLISLTRKPMDPAELASYDIENLWFPIDDMKAPSTKEAAELCAKVEKLLDEGHIVAMHCKAGLGRTGTMLAAQLIWEGKSAMDALDEARRVEPRWVQSEVQVEFLEIFEKELSNLRGYDSSRDVVKISSR